MRTESIIASHAGHQRRDHRLGICSCIALALLAACSTSTTTGEVQQAVLYTPLNPSQGGTFSARSAPTYRCSSLPGSFCFDGVTAPLTEGIDVAGYLDSAAQSWGCVFQPGWNPVEDLGEGNFRRFYGNQSGDGSHNHCGVVYWNRARQAAYFLAISATFSNGSPSGTDRHLYSKWIATGGPTGSLGLPITNPSPNSSLGVTYQLFTNGVITYAPSVGAFAAGGAWSSDQAVAAGFEIENHLTTGQPNVALAPPPSNPLSADSACTSASPGAPTSCSVMRTGSWVSFKDVLSASKLGVVVETGYVLARNDWKTGFAISGAVAPTWTRAFGTPPDGCPWCATFGFPLTPLHTYLGTFDPTPYPIYSQSFEHGSITYAPTACTNPFTPTYVATINNVQHPPYAATHVTSCPGIPMSPPCTTSEPVPFHVTTNQGTYTLDCGANGHYAGITIDWTDVANYPHRVTVKGDIFSAWVRNNPAGAGKIEDAMDSGQSSIGGAPILGMPFENQVCRDAACTQIDQTFDRGWVFDDAHHLTFTRDYRDTLTYFDVRAKSYHNTFAHNEPLWDLLTYYRVRSVEFDFHADKFNSSTNRNYQAVGHGAPNGADWFVYHYQGFTTDGDSRCFRLSDCLKELKAWHEANPYHEVITVFGDAGINSTFGPIGLATNPAWNSSHRPLDFDDRIQRDLAGDAPDGTPLLFTPVRLVSWCAEKLGTRVYSLRDATHRCGWPTLKELRGHVIWVMTTKNGDPAYGVNTYVDPSQNGGHEPDEMAAFAIDEFPVGDPNNSGWDVVFYNYGTCDSPGCHDEVTDGDRTHVIETHDDGGAAMHYITRLYSNDSPGTFNAARRNSLSGSSYLAPANFIATHQATDQNLRTMPLQSRGYPFECIDGADKPAGTCSTAGWIESSAPAIRFVGSSGSITSTSELARLQHVSIDPGTRWVWSAGVIGDRLDHPGVYGCLEARHSSAIDDAFVAVCRDNQSSEVTRGSANLFWRLTQGGPIRSQQLYIDSGMFPGYDGYGLEQQHAVFLKLSVFRESDLVTRALVYTSRDGVHWGCDAGTCDHSVDFESLPGSLPYQGLSLSTNNQGIFEFFFLNTHVRGFAGATTYYDPGDGTLILDKLETAGDLNTPVGNGAFGDLGNGLGSF